MTDDLGTPHLRFDRDGPLGWCIIDRPRARNALTGAMYLGIRRAVDLVNTDPDLAALIITGTGDVFAPGGEMSGRGDDAGMARALGTDVLPFKAIRQSPAPVIAAVNGLCQGGGLMIAMLADVAVASDAATFRAPELLRGVADAYYAAVLPAHVGIARAREIMFTGRAIDAAEAVQIGLIARVVPHDTVRDAAAAVARDVLQTAPRARFQWKRLVNEGYGPIDEMTFNDSIRSDECVEGFQAFTEKRAPGWIPAAFRSTKRL